MSANPPQPHLAPSQAGQEDPGTGHLLAEAARDLSELIDRQWEMAKAEVKSEYRQARQAASMAAIGAATALVSILLLSLALAEGLNQVLPTWASYLIVGVLAGVAAVGLFRCASARVEGVNMLPDRTLRTLTEDRR